ncbi:hypothetical protein [Emticicia fontis]
MDVTLVLYRISGWSQDIVWLFICWMILKRRWYWTQYKSFFLVYAISVTIFEIVFAITALTMSNNHFLNYMYSTLEFIILSFFLKGIIQFKWIHYFVYVASIVFLLITFFYAFSGVGYANYNTYGSLIKNLYLTILAGLSLFVLSQRNVNRRLFSLAESWLVFSIFLIYMSIIIFDYLFGLAVPYKNDTILYAVLITRNFLKSFFLFFYIKGIFIIKRDKSVERVLVHSD